MDAPAPSWLEHLPHRPPFRFITTVESVIPGVRGEAVWRVTGSEDFFAGHFPGEPLVPGVLLSEALAQLSGLVGVHGTGRSGGRLIHVDMRYKSVVRPPAEITLRSVQVRAMGPLVQFEVEALVAGHCVSRGTLALAGVEGSNT